MATSTNYLSWHFAASEHGDNKDPTSLSAESPDVSMSLSSIASMSIMSVSVDKSPNGSEITSVGGATEELASEPKLVAVEFDADDC